MIKKLSILLLVLTFFVSPAIAADSGDGRKVVAVAGTAEAISATKISFRYVQICAETDNTGDIAVGVSPVAADLSEEGMLLTAGQCFAIERSYDLQSLKVDSTISGDGIAYFWLE